jgi:hypothetical protein
MSDIDSLLQDLDEVVGDNQSNSIKYVPHRPVKEKSPTQVNIFFMQIQIINNNNTG